MTSQCLELKFVNSTTLEDSKVFITFQIIPGGQPDFDVTYGSGKAVSFKAADCIISESLSLKDIGPAGFEVTRAEGVVIYVSYGAPLTSTTSAPAYIGGGTDYGTLFQPFELTRTGNPGDQGDMTAINYFAAPMKISSYGQDASKPLQSVGYLTGANQIGNEISKLTGANPLSRITNTGGYLVRYIGPSSFNPQDATIPFPTFVPYLQAVYKAGQQTKIANNNAFVYPPAGTNGSTNYNFILDMTATAQADGSIVLDGTISTEITPAGQAPSPGKSFSGCKLTISAADENLYNGVIYGQAFAGNSAVSFSGGWSELKAYITSLGLDPQDAYGTTQRLAVGEITSGLLMGFVNSQVTPKGGTIPIKDMTSRDWWTITPVIAFEDVQPDHPYYNTYAQVIYSASGNEAYSIPYSDRLGDGPLVNSVSFENQDVLSWTVELLPPLATPV
ncbi:hypothetical protein [Roseibium litorale]|uniref:Beta-1,3-glucanase n=1 Tax=Roseibium litorale TaxID=2803841 RepID=A0ABR9CIG8_9HYPH|nr:hypothetical protein [Roseibium litorale]MBD8890624.1 hypothetical protein [Roseibium litorale]